MHCGNWHGRETRCAVNATTQQSWQFCILVHPSIHWLFLFVAYFQLYLVAVHVPRIHNEAADALSRNNLFLLTPGAQPFTTPIPQCLLDGLDDLILATPDGASPTWTATLCSILHKDWHRLQSRHTSQE